MEIGVKASFPPGTCCFLAIHWYFGGKFIKRKKGEQQCLYSVLHIIKLKKGIKHKFQINIFKYSITQLLSKYSLW